jgi:hypothetical protein
MSEDFAWVGEKLREESRLVPRAARVALRELADAALAMAKPIWCRYPSDGRDVASWVYVVHAPEVARVKIGTTTTAGDGLKYRMRSLSAMSPCRLEIVALSIGGRGLEREWHAKYREHRHHGEWFAAGDIVEHFAAAMAAAGPNGCARCAIKNDQADIPSLPKAPSP